MNELYIQPNYEIIPENTETNKIYTLRMIVYLPGVPKENISTKIINGTLNIHGVTNISDVEWSIEEKIYQGNIPLPKFNEQNLKIKYINGALKVTITNDISSDINID